MASTACALINNPKKLLEAKEAFTRQIEKHPYICPIPDGTMPPIVKLAPRSYIIGILASLLAICIVCVARALGAVPELQSRWRPRHGAALCVRVDPPGLLVSST